MASHPETTEFRTHAFGEQLHVVLRKNHALFHADYVEEYLQYAYCAYFMFSICTVGHSYENGVLVKREARNKTAATEHCYYHGYVESSDGYARVTLLLHCFDFYGM